MRRTVILLAILAAAACGRDTTDKSNNGDNGSNNGGSNNGGTNNRVNNGASNNGASNNGASNNGATNNGATNNGANNGTAVVETTLGPVSGATERGVARYLGIPYAAPPVGLLRFQPPAVHDGWADTLAATEFGPSCPQRAPNNASQIDGDEDCLTLNVWAPEGGTDLPVMVWIHGGGFVQGSSNFALYDGQSIAERDVVVVSINYRLGPLGFLATDELVDESGEGSAGNYGFRDQAFALQWVQDNVAAFGGNRDNVTIFGESAGGVSVCAHLASPLSEGKFARGIIESGGGCFGMTLLDTPTNGRQSAIEIGDAFVAAAGCDGAVDPLQCLRDASFSDLVQAQYDIDASGLGLPPFGPNVDGVAIAGDALTLFEAGGWTDVPVITGSNADEATVFTTSIPIPGPTAYETAVRSVFGMQADDVLQIYPVGDFPSAKAAFNALFSDVGFICPALGFARAASGGTEPAYTYHFTRVLPGPAGALGAFHGLEIFYVFGSFDAAPAYQPNVDDLALHEAMQSAWVAFATDGTPTSTPSWAPFDPANPQIQLFDTSVSSTAEIRDGRCEGLRGLGLAP